MYKFWQELTNKKQHELVDVDNRCDIMKTFSERKIETVLEIEAGSYEKTIRKI